MLSTYSLFLICGWLILILSISLLCSKFLPNEKELGRKIVHIGTGPLIPIAWWLKVSSNIAIPIACLITIALILNYRFKILTSIESIERKSFGTITYALSITLLIIFFWANYPSAVIAGVLVMAFGDGLAGLIGRKINSPYWMILGQKKSIIGTLTMGLVGAVVLSIVNQITGIGLIFIDILTLTSLAIVLEQISPLGIDNLTVPIGIAVSWKWMIIN